MPIFEVRERKKDYLDLLLLADEQESMIDRYLEKGTMYGLEEGGVVRGVCVVTDEAVVRRHGTLCCLEIAIRPKCKSRVSWN